MSIRAASRKEQRFASTLAIAISLVGFGVAVRAQSFQGTSNVVAGSASVFATGNTTTVTVRSPSAVINWTPTDTATGSSPINFQPSGTTATFTNDPRSTANFAVLNNILPAASNRQIQLNGTIVSQLQSAAAGTSTGGTVYFYSPAGILVGPSAVINVGNLGLTASPIIFDPSTGSFGATGAVPGNPAQTVHFLQSNSGAKIDIARGAQISANGGDGSYVAIVAPVINNSGTMTVNGNAALVAADAATITFDPSGFYAISMDVGTSASGTTLFSDGTITGSASTRSTTGGPAHQIYLMTAPKNSLITLAIGQGGNLGFDIAGAAQTFDNTV